ncbi:MAG: ABC transporter permease, partial [Pseudomonadota bacterium]
GIVARTFETLNAMSQFILLPLIYLGGVFYPVYYLPPFWQKWARRLILTNEELKRCQAVMISSQVRRRGGVG